MNIQKDIYEYLTNFADDKTIVNMLSVNKTFRNEEFFKRVLERKYPLLIKFKNKKQRWKDLYLRKAYENKIFNFTDDSKKQMKTENHFDNNDGYFNTKMLSGNKDVDLYKILMNLDDDSLLNFCKSAVKQEYEKSLCADETFWKLRMKNYYPSYYHLNNQSWKDFYLKMVYYLSKLEELSGIPYISSEYFNPESFYKLYINSQKAMLNMAMNYASDSGQMDIVELMVKKGADSYNSAIIYAAEEGHMDIINYFIEKGANNWNGAIGGAAKGGHMNIIQFLLTKKPNNLNPGLLGAIKGGHNDILNLMIEKGANDWNQGLKIAAENENMDIINLMIEKGADDWDKGLLGAASTGNFDLVNFFIEKGSTDWNKGLLGAVKAKKYNLIKFFMEKEADDWDGAIRNSIIINDIELVKYFLSWGADISQAVAFAIKLDLKESRSEILNYLSDYINTSMAI